MTAQVRINGPDHGAVCAAEVADGFVIGAIVFSKPYIINTQFYTIL